MRYLKLYFLIVFLHFAELNGYSQLIHFSQFFSAPLNVNPALTGVLNGDWRLISNARSQSIYFGETLNTYSIAYDRPFRFRDGFVGGGVLYNYDNSLGLSIPSSMLYASLGGMLKVSGNSFLGAGFQVGYVYRSFNSRLLSFPEQYDRNTGGFNSQLPISESFERSFSEYIDVNLGMLWNFQKENMNAINGVAVYHLNQPIDEFLNDESRIKPRFNYHTSIQYFISKKHYVIPQGYYTFQNKAYQYLIGSGIGFLLPKNKSGFKDLEVGIYVRNSFTTKSQSVIAFLGLGYLNWKMNFSFDYDASGTQSNGLLTNAFELTLIYVRPTALLEKIAIPCIRY